MTAKASDERAIQTLREALDQLELLRVAGDETVNASYDDIDHARMWLDDYANTL